MNEKIFNTELKNSLVKAGAWAYKIPDFPVGKGSRFRFNPEKPCDIVGVYKGFPFLIESKQIKEVKNFPLSRLRKSQISNLNRAQDAGARCLLALNIRLKSSNTLALFPWPLVKDINHLYGGKIPIEEMLKDSRFHIKGKRGLFNLDLDYLIADDLSY